MSLKKLSPFLIFISCLIIAMNGYGITMPYPGQTLQIDTQLSTVFGKPTWVLIIRDMESGRILPFLFDFTVKNNSWVAFTTSRTYKVTSSSLTFGPYAVVPNFCHLENGTITDQSMSIKLRGELSPNPDDYVCSVSKYNDIPFPLVGN